jgi:CTP:molybdopterin cytidylyltransferase MocA
VSEGVGNSQGERSVTVLVNGDDPETYRAEVERLVREAGLNVTLSVKPNPARAG